ncbi:MAG: TIGR00730 family Rossman fold protein [Geminicoccaceae bacterium]
MAMSICVFCGSRYGADPRFAAAATRLGALAGAVGLRLIYGGGHVGLMGAVADAAMAADAEVIGVIPTRLLAREVGHRAITELVVTRSMHERKQEMIDRADGFVVLPGGLGTLDELLEVVTLRQLGYHDKPIVLVNLGGYWDPLLAVVERVIAEDFAAPGARRLFDLVDSVEEVLPRLAIEARPVVPLRAAQGE